VDGGGFFVESMRLIIRHIAESGNLEGCIIMKCLRTWLTGTLPVAILLSGLFACQGQPVAESGLTVPFKLERNKIIIPTKVNGSRPLNLILDTGMRFDGVYLFRKELADELDMTGAIDVRVPGAGSGEASTAQMIESGSLTFGDITVDSQRVIISSSPHTQRFPTDGVIGWNLFGHYAAEVDYDRELIILHDTAEIAPDSSWTMIPVTMKDGLPFFDAKIEVVAGEVVPVTLYIDLASSDALEMLVSENQKYTIPDSVQQSQLGVGLSGEIRGTRGTSQRAWIGDYSLSMIPTSFAPADVRSKQEGADGILGNRFMSRFNTIYDYTHSRLYLKPSKYYEEPF
jgi:hypothetical protein